MMKRKILIGLSLFFGLVFVGAPQASAFDPFPDNICNRAGAGNSPACRDDGTETPIGVIGRIIQVMAIVTGVAAIIVIIIGGLQYILSSGDPSAISNAKNTILYAIIGLAVAASAQLLVRYFVTRI